jgi:hypothetical protein
MTKSAQAKELDRLRQREACKNLRRALEMTAKIGVTATMVTGFAITWFADSQAAHFDEAKMSGLLVELSAAV